MTLQEAPVFDVKQAEAQFHELLPQLDELFLELHQWYSQTFEGVPPSDTCTITILSQYIVQESDSARATPMAAFRYRDVALVVNELYAGLQKHNPQDWRQRWYECTFQPKYIPKLLHQ
jgi:hypothetical protein